MSRERVYREFLRLHAPSKCNVFYGGFTFGSNGSESSQLDVIVTTDTTPQFNFHNADGSGKSFSPVDGTLAVASIKSMLNKNELEDALLGIASLPPTEPLEDRLTLAVVINNYDDWPYKIIYATDGVAAETLLSHLNAFYVAHPEIPVGRRPNIIHVSGKYVVIRAISGMSMFNPAKGVSEPLELGTFRILTRDSDLQGILWVLDGLQQRATASTHILHSYGNLMNHVTGVRKGAGKPK